MNRNKAKNESKVQTVVIGKAAKLYDLIKSKSKSSAMTTAILLLARDERSREIFFDDLEKVDAILEGKDKGFNDIDTDKPEQEEGWE